MRHGRLIPRQLPRPAACRSAACALLLWAARGASAQATAPTPLRLCWDEPNHESGIYYVKDEATLTVLAENPGRDAADLTGEILFGTRTAGTAGTGDFKILTVTPIADAPIGGGQRARIPLKVTFGAAGSYELRWHHGEATEPIAGNARSASLECIFAPRTALVGGNPTNEDAPWIAFLPDAAVHHPGLLKDYASQTTVRHFFVDERFSFDAARNVGLGFGASTGGTLREIDGLLAQAATDKSKLILRVAVPIPATLAAGDKSMVAFRQYITDALQRSRGSLGAIAITPAQADPLSDAQRRNYLTYYLAGYDAARKADKNVLLLGAGSARLTAECFTDPKLLGYIDALAIADAAQEPVAARQFLHKAGVKKPLWLLPPVPGIAWTPPAAGLAAGAAQVAVPGPEVDHGVTAHLLGGTVFVQRLQITVPTSDPTDPQASNIPFVAMFQGDGYGVAAVAGFSAGADLDAQYPHLARTRTEVAPSVADDGPTYPALQVGDDSHAMRVVDAAGAPVDCRVGDTMFVPAADNIVYVLAGGTAEDLAGSLRVANLRRLPVFEPALGATATGLALRLRNISTHSLAGAVRVIRTPDGQPAQVLAEKDFDAIPPDKTLELPLPVSADVLATLRGPLVVEITTLGSKSLVQRTALIVEQAQP